MKVSQETIDENVLIAEFMGFKSEGEGIFGHNEVHSYWVDIKLFDSPRRHSLHKLAFHESWDHLVPVISKVCQTNAEWMNEGKPYINNLSEGIESAVINDKIVYAHGLVVKFVKHYNKHS